MKHVSLLVIFLLCLFRVHAQKVVRSDLDNFWGAYDKITTTQNDSLRRHYLDVLFLSKASEGQKTLMEKVWDFRPYNILRAIRHYPSFWGCLRQNTSVLDKLETELSSDMAKLRQLYPPFKPATFYFAVGDFRTRSMVSGNSVIMGTETFFCDEDSVPDGTIIRYGDHRNPAWADDDLGYVTQLCLRAYIHTKQKPDGKELLGECVYEGVAEFMAALATGKPSPTAAFVYGKTHITNVKRRFEKDIFYLKTDTWLSVDDINEFKTAYLGKYMGYAICEGYYKAATNKKEAIRRMMHLDYGNRKDVEMFVDRSGFLSAPVSELRSKFNYERPTVTGIKEFENKSRMVDPAISTITLLFSMPLNKEYHGFTYGPMGGKCFPDYFEFLGFSEDGRSATVAVKLEPLTRYQIVVQDDFESLSGIPLQGTMIDITTGER